MNVLSLFSGIGAFEKALDNLGITYELTGFSEIDKYAVKSYCAIHNVDESQNLGDITKIDETALPKNIELITYGFPCQDISLAGHQKGLFNDDGTQTRSGLFFEALRIIETTQPKVAIAENVKNLTSKKFAEQFKIVLESLEAAGYNNYWQVLNAKGFGIPQNRERVFIVSIRKDIDNGGFAFPEGFPLELRLKDMLEDETDAKFYLDGKFESITKVNENYSIMNCGLIGKMHDISRRAYSGNATAPTIPTCSGGNIQPKVLLEPTIQRVDIPQTVKFRKYAVDTNRLCETLRHYKALQYLTNQDISVCLGVPVTKVEHWFRQDDCFAIPDPDIWMQLKKLLKIDTDEFDEAIMTFEEKEGVYEKSERHYFADGIMPTLTSATAGCEKIITSEPVCLNSKGGRGGVEGLQPSLQDRIYDSNAISTAVTTSFMPSFTDGLRIRKLTPKECFRLMGFADADFEKAEAVNSNTQLYKQAGNSIVVPVVEYIIKALVVCGALDCSMIH